MDQLADGYLARLVMNSMLAITKVVALQLEQHWLIVRLGTLPVFLMDQLVYQ